MLCVPADSHDVVKVAMPLPSSATVPSVKAPSLNVAVPVGVPLPGGTTVTVAVNVTPWPNVDGFADAVSTVWVAGLFTVSVPDAAAPGGASEDVTCDVVFTNAPTAIPRTLTVMVHDCPGARTADVLENVSVPGLIENIPPAVAGVLHVPPVWVIRSIPAGM